MCEVMAALVSPEYPTNTLCIPAPFTGAYAAQTSCKPSLWCDNTRKLNLMRNIASVKDVPAVMVTPEYPTNTLCISAPFTGAYAEQTPSLPECSIVTTPIKGEPLSKARHVSHTLEFRPLPSLSQCNERDGSRESCDGCTVKTLSIIGEVAFVGVERSLLLEVGGR